MTTFSPKPAMTLRCRLFGHKWRDTTFGDRPPDWITAGTLAASTIVYRCTRCSAVTDLKGSARA